MFVTIAEWHTGEKLFPSGFGFVETFDDRQSTFDLLNEEFLCRFRDIVRGVLLRKGWCDDRHEMLMIMKIYSRIPNRESQPELRRPV